MKSTAFDVVQIVCLALIIGSWMFVLIMLMSHLGVGS